MEDTMPSSLFLIALALGGFALATFIHFKKKQEIPLVCPIVGHSCDPVVHSDYSRLLGIPLEILGMFYYGIIGIAYIALAVTPDLGSSVLSSLLFFLSLLALIFSSYLTAVQAFVLRQWCTWCLISALLCTLIFLTELSLSGITLSSLFAF